MANSRNQRRLSALETRHGQDRGEDQLMLQLLEWFIAGYGHLVDWDLFERLGAAAEKLRGIAYTNESVKLIVDYRDDAAAADPAAGSAFDRALDEGLQHRISPPGLDHQDTDRRARGINQEIHQ